MSGKQVKIAPGVFAVCTMSATVIVPERDNQCCQWVTFNSDNEPVLNTGQERDNGIDTFLKRLQRAKQYNSKDGSLPSGQQFCFEAVVDKRYNRWKRRRRKKKASEARRTDRPQSSDSSDEDDKAAAVENILNRMYEQIHGALPQTPNGTKDTPRVRRRRLKDRNNQEQGTSFGNGSLFYDASSEWNSDIDGALNSSSSGADNLFYGARRKHTLRESNNGVGAFNEDDLCSWPFIEEYKEEIMRRIHAVPPDQLDHLDQEDWLPDIVQTPRSRVSRSLEGDVIKRGAGISADDECETEASLSEMYETITPILVDSQSPRQRLYTDANGVTYSYSKWSRSQKSLATSSTAPDHPQRVRIQGDPAGGVERAPGGAQYIGVVSVGEQGRGCEFSAALKPVRTPMVPNRQQKPKKPIQKEVSVIKKQTINFPSLSKNTKTQTQTYNNRAGKTSKEII